jgi:acyl-CoA dehydrogenase
LAAALPVLEGKMDFELDSEIAELAARVRSFIDESVIPAEAQFLQAEDESATAAEIDRLRLEAKERGLYLPHMPEEYGGQNVGFLGMCSLFEEAGRSPLGPLALHCSAPDEGNMHLLLHWGTEEQKERYLRPLADGRIRSCFAMTEPAPGAGADPTMMQATAVLDGDEWVIEGKKWFTTGADGAAFAIAAAVTDPDAPPHERTSLFLVDADNPGFSVERRTPVIGSEGPGGHCEVTFSECRVPEDAMLGGRGQGFALMQFRLGPARLTHCMRWIGAARRCFEIATRRAVEREAFGHLIGDYQAVQWMLVDSYMDLHASRLMTMHAAWKLAKGDQARRETSMCKVFVAEAVGRVIDRAVQVLGGLGVTKYTPVGAFYADVRAFRIYDGPSEVHRMSVARSLLKEARATKRPDV